MTADVRGWEIVVLGVMADQVLLFVKHVPKSSVSYVANEFMGYTSRVLRSEFGHLLLRLPTLWPWYFVVSMGVVSVDVVRRYIDNRWERA